MPSSPRVRHRPRRGGSDSDVGEGGWGGWVAEHEQDPDLRLILSDADSDHEGGGAKGAHHDAVADGWVVENMHPFRRAIDLGIMLEEVASDILPLLVRNPADADALRRLRTHARAIRRVGKQLPGLMGQAPVTLGNFLKNTAVGALRRGTGGAAWMASRCDRVLARVLGLYEDERVNFHDLD